MDFGVCILQPELPKLREAECLECGQGLLAADPCVIHSSQVEAQALDSKPYYLSLSTVPLLETGSGNNRKPPCDLRELLGRPSLAGRQDVGPSGRGSLLLIWVGFLLAWLMASWPSPHQLHFSFHQPVQSQGPQGFPGANAECVWGGRGSGMLSLALKSQPAPALPLVPVMYGESCRRVCGPSSDTSVPRGTGQGATAWLLLTVGSSLRASYQDAHILVSKGPVPLLR